jgi:hypothetical protein
MPGGLPYERPEMGLGSFGILGLGWMGEDSFDAESLRRREFSLVSYDLRFMEIGEGRPGVVRISAEDGCGRDGVECLEMGLGSFGMPGVQRIWRLRTE